MDVGTLLSVISIVISLVLSVAGVLLSFWFYKESNKQNKETSIMQIEIKETVKKLEKLYDRTYTDTFGALRGQMNAMQKHIFSTSIGATSEAEPDNLKIYLLGCLSQITIISVEDVCEQIRGFEKSSIIETIYQFHRDGLIEFDGKTIKNLRKTPSNSEINGEGVISK